MTAAFTRIVPHRALVPAAPGDDGRDGGAPAAAWIVPISETLSLAAFDLPPARQLAPVDGALDGVLLERPLLSSAVPLRSGGARQVVVLRHPAADVAQRRLQLSLAGRVQAVIDPAWLQSPIREPIDLVAGVTAAGASRLLRLLLSGIPSLFGPGLGSGFNGSARTLLDLLQVPQGKLVARSRLGTAGEVLSYRMPGAPAALPATLVALAGARVERITPAGSLLEDTTLLHLFRPGRGRLAADLVMLGAAPVWLTAGDEPPEPQPFLSWLARRPAPTRTWGETLLHHHAARNRAAAALLREHRHAADFPPKAQVHMVAATRTGALVWLDVADPRRLVTAVRAEIGGRPSDIPVPPSGQVRAFLALGARQDAGTAGRLRFVYGSGRLSTFHEGVLDPFTGSIPQDPATEAPGEAGRALAAAFTDRVQPVLRPQVTDHGLRGPHPALAVIVPLAPVPDLVRARAALVASDGARDAVEILYTLAGSPSAMAGDLLRDTAAVYGVTHRLVSLPAGTTAPDLLVAALKAARADSLLLLGRDVLPQGTGWAARWIARLTQEAGPALVGGTLLGHDGSVEHAGGDVRWFGPADPAVCDLRARGLPARDLGEAEFLPGDVLTQDAVGLTAAAKALLIAQGAICADPAILLQLAAYRLGAATDLRNRVMRFAPEPEVDPVVRASGLFRLGTFLAAAAEPAGR